MRPWGPSVAVGVVVVEGVGVGGVLVFEGIGGQKAVMCGVVEPLTEMDEASGIVAFRGVPPGTDGVFRVLRNRVSLDF